MENHDQHPYNATRDIVHGLGPIFEKSKCTFAYLVGSYATGTSGWWSDVDIFVHVLGVDSLPDDEKIKLMLGLATSIELQAGIKNVDVRLIDMLPVHVQFHAIATGVLIYENDNGVERRDYIERLLHEYYEYHEWYEKIIDERLKA